MLLETQTLSVFTLCFKISVTVVEKKKQGNLFLRQLSYIIYETILEICGKVAVYCLHKVTQYSCTRRLNCKNLKFNRTGLKFGTRLYKGCVAIHVKFHFFIYRNNIFIKLFVLGPFSKIAEKLIRKMFKWQKFIKNSGTWNCN